MNSDMEIRDFVFPLMVVQPADSGVRMTAFQGSAFLLDRPAGFAVTAGHVADQLAVGSAAGAFVSDGNWICWSVDEIRRHATEDVAVLVMSPERTWPSPLQLTPRHVAASARYRVWGYPVDVLREIRHEGIAMPRPELVYSEGHVRRRLTGIPLDAIRGEGFLELSAVAGRGCSGAPVTLDAPGVDPWQVIGVYAGDRYNETERIAVGYAARIDAVLDLTSDRDGGTQGSERA